MVTLQPQRSCPLAPRELSRDVKRLECVQASDDVIALCTSMCHRGANAEAEADGYDSEGGSPGADRGASEPLPVRFILQVLQSHEALPCLASIAVCFRSGQGQPEGPLSLPMGHCKHLAAKGS